MKNPSDSSGSQPIFNDAGIQQINSRDSQKLKLARAVRDGRERSKIFVEGLRLCEEILKSDLKINSVFITNKFRTGPPRNHELLRILVTKNLELLEAEEKIFDSLADTKQSQGIVIIAGRPETGKGVIEEKLWKSDIKSPFLILVHQLNNPANIGAVLRTAEAAGINGIISTKNTTDIYSAKSLRGAMGAGFRLPAWTDADFFEVLEWARLKGIRSICADINSPKSYLEIDWRIPRLLILGSEGHGLTTAEREATDESLIIPMENGVESLNVAVACGVILFEAKRQRL